MGHQIQKLFYHVLERDKGGGGYFEKLNFLEIGQVVIFFLFFLIIKRMKSVASRSGHLLQSYDSF